MVKLSREIWVTALILLALLLLPPVAYGLDQPFYVEVWSRIMIYALAASSLNLILGYGGMVSFGHAAYFGIGGYVVGILSFHSTEFLPLIGGWEGTTSAFISWPLAVIISGLIALVLGAISLRTSGVYFIMITLAFAQMVFYFFISLEAYGGDDGLMIARRSDFPPLDLADFFYGHVYLYYVALVALFGFLYLKSRLIGSRFGMVLQGAKQNERRMASLGYPVYRYKLAAFVIAGAVCGFAGALWANHQTFISPDSMAWTKSGELMVMVILGGMGTLMGPVVGAAVLLTLEAVLASYTEHWAFFLGPILILVVLFARNGIWGWVVGRGREDGR